MDQKEVSEKSHVWFLKGELPIPSTKNIFIYKTKWPQAAFIIVRGP